MSKGIDSPAASTFTSPTKVGWLYKHGGSGISSHWKKRWFIADNHYLFYYKGPNDKKPVGILCLPEYGSCQKADSKEWKKSFPFILGRKEGSQDTTDGNNSPGKDYVLYTESEGELNEWIKAIQGEMKSGHFGGANGGPVSSAANKVDQVALDEVSKAASDGPKLTHLTVQRPRMKGRRPPKRYATYHEEEKEETPPTTPLIEKKEPLTATNLPKAIVKGRHPTIPLKPKPRAQSNIHTAVHEHTFPKSNKKTPPIPPVKPILDNEENNTKKKTLETPAIRVPTPKQRPVPPKRPKTQLSSGSIVPNTEIINPAPKPVPVPRKRTDVGLNEVPHRQENDGLKGKIESTSGGEEIPANTPTGEEIEVKQGGHMQENVIQPPTGGSMKEEQNTEPELEPQQEAVELSVEVVMETAAVAATIALAEENETETETDNKKLDKAGAEMDETAHLVLTTDEESCAVQNTSNTDSRPSEESRDGEGNEYEPVQPEVSEETRKDLEIFQKATKSPEYQEPHEWNPDENTSNQDSAQGPVNYDVPPPARPAETKYDIPRSTLTAANESSNAVLVSVDDEEAAANIKENSPSLTNTNLPPPIKRDSMGYTKVVKQKSTDNVESVSLSDEETPALWTDMESTSVDSIPATLQQAREILRLAQILKKEVDDMRQEVHQELALAQKERQAAELLKKNATEILRMAKTKLNPTLS